MGVTPSCEKPRVGDMGEVVIVGDGDEDKLVCSGWCVFPAGLRWRLLVELFMESRFELFVIVAVLFLPAAAAADFCCHAVAAAVPLGLLLSRSLSPRIVPLSHKELLPAWLTTSAVLSHPHHVIVLCCTPPTPLTQVGAPSPCSSLRTWSSTSGIRRDIFISSLHPCDAQGDGDDGDANDNVFPPGESSKVDVSDTCTPASFGVGMMFMTVAVQGTSDAHFSIMASLVGKVRRIFFSAVMYTVRNYS